MKKTDFIKKAAALIEEHGNNQQYRGYSYEGMAEVYLEIVESLGMQPPLTETNEQIDRWRHVWDETFLVCTHPKDEVRSYKNIDNVMNYFCGGCKKKVRLKVKK